MNIQLAARRRRARLAAAATVSSAPAAVFSTNGVNQDDGDSDGDSTCRRVTKISTLSAAPDDPLHSAQSFEKSKVVPRSDIQANGLKDADDTPQKRSQPRSQIAAMLERRKREAAGMSDGDDGGTDMSAAAFRKQLASCAEDTGVQQYAATPVEGFGLAALRAMGWKGDVIDADDKDDIPAPRTERLGLGMKRASAEAPPSRKKMRMRGGSVDGGSADKRRRDGERETLKEATGKQ